MMGVPACGVIIAAARCDRKSLGTSTAQIVLKLDFLIASAVPPDGFCVSGFM